MQSVPVLHVVWCSEYRRKVLVSGADTGLKHLIHEVCEENRIEIIEMEIRPNPVHLFMETVLQFGIRKVVKRNKGRSPDG